MGLFAFFRNSKRDKTPILTKDDYIPAFWEDDYCQIEIVPSENKSFILKQAAQIDELSQKSKTRYGFSETFARGSMPTKTSSREIRVDYLERTLLSSKFQKAKHIRYENELLNCEISKTKAFGFSNFTVFYDTDTEFVKNIWLIIGLLVSAPQFDLIQHALYTLGVDCELILIDWNSLELLDLADRRQIHKYLMHSWK